MGEKWSVNYVDMWYVPRVNLGHVKLKVGFGSARAYNFLVFCQKHTQTFFYKCDEIYPKLTAKCKNSKEYRKIDKNFSRTVYNRT